MAGPACIPQTLWAGDNTPPLVWGFGPVGTSEIPVGAQFVLEIAAALAMASGASPQGPTVLITATSAPGGDGSLVVDPVGGTVTWTYTTAQSAGLPPGARTRYVLRCLYGGQTQVWAYGSLAVRGFA